jgi:xanthine dehydrogenase YagT iron-sulfur-binding subunit
MDRRGDAGGGVSRRGVLGAGAAGLAAPLAVGEARAARPSRSLAGDIDMTLTVNGRPRALTADVRTTLLDALREKLGLTGTKKGCDHGQCGACTVLMDGRARLSCLTLAVAAQGPAIVTIEGLAAEGSLSPMQTAFVEHDAFQCGYCTPGQILAAEACVREGHAASDAAIAEYMSGNICRCGAYPHIVRAIAQAAGRA